MYNESEIKNFSEKDNDITKKISSNDDEAILKNTNEVTSIEPKQNADKLENQMKKTQKADTLGIP